MTSSISSFIPTRMASPRIITQAPLTGGPISVNQGGVLSSTMQTFTITPNHSSTISKSNLSMLGLHGIETIGQSQSVMLVNNRIYSSVFVVSSDPLTGTFLTLQTAINAALIDPTQNSKIEIRANTYTEDQVSIVIPNNVHLIMSGLEDGVLWTTNTGISIQLGLNSSLTWQNLNFSSSGLMTIDLQSGSLLEIDHCTLSANMTSTLGPSCVIRIQDSNLNEMNIVHNGDHAQINYNHCTLTNCFIDIPSLPGPVSIHLFDSVFVNNSLDQAIDYAVMQFNNSTLVEVNSCNFQIMNASCHQAVVLKLIHCSATISQCTFNLMYNQIPLIMPSLICGIQIAPDSTNEFLEILIANCRFYNDAQVPLATKMIQGINCMGNPGSSTNDSDISIQNCYFENEGDANSSTSLSMQGFRHVCVLACQFTAVQGGNLIWYQLGPTNDPVTYGSGGNVAVSSSLQLLGCSLSSLTTDGSSLPLIQADCSGGTPAVDWGQIHGWLFVLNSMIQSDNNSTIANSAPFYISSASNSDTNAQYIYTVVDHVVLERTGGYNTSVTAPPWFISGGDNETLYYGAIYRGLLAPMTFDTASGPLTRIAMSTSS
jgi:hypothetical protein